MTIIKKIKTNETYKKEPDENYDLGLCI